MMLDVGAPPLEAEAVGGMAPSGVLEARVQLKHTRPGRREASRSRVPLRQRGGAPGAALPLTTGGQGCGDGAEGS